MVRLHQDEWRFNVRSPCVAVTHCSRNRRAGLLPEPGSFKAFMKRVFASPAISVFGFYTHAGNSYGSTSLEQATTYLTGEVRVTNDAAAMALEVLAESGNREAHHQPFVLSVGSTPTAHSATAAAKLKITSALSGKLELHTGIPASSRTRMDLAWSKHDLCRKLHYARSPAGTHNFD
jgi:D-serine deaminase-like pyridoxal phosphate-dependent protein